MRLNEERQRTLYAGSIGSQQAGFTTRRDSMIEMGSKSVDAHCQFLLDVQWKLCTFASKKTSHGSQHCPQQQDHYEADTVHHDKLLI